MPIRQSLGEEADWQDLESMSGEVGSSKSPILQALHADQWSQVETHGGYRQAWKYRFPTKAYSRLNASTVMEQPAKRATTAIDFNIRVD